MSSTTIQTRVDTTLKNNAEKVLSSIGLDMTSAIRLFLSQVVNQKKIPFEAVASNDFSLDGYQYEDLNDETKDALLESRSIAEGKTNSQSYVSFDEMLKNNGLLHVADSSNSK